MTSLHALNADFRDFLTALCDANVEFVIVGAYAVAVHGVPRSTGDIDVLVRASAENAQRVESALARFGAPLGAIDAEARDFEREGTVVQIGVPPRRIDVLTRIAGVSFDEAWATRVTADLGGQEVGVLGREALLRNKRAAGRPKDLSDVRRLERLRKPR